MKSICLRFFLMWLAGWLCFGTPLWASVDLSAHPPLPSRCSVQSELECGGPFFIVAIDVLILQFNADGVQDAAQKALVGCVLSFFDQHSSDFGSSFYVFTDHLGTPFAWKNAGTGEITYTPFNPWGELLATNPNRGPPHAHGNVPNLAFSVPQLQDQQLPPIGLAGHLYNEQTGLYAMHYRVYNPRLGTFLTPDFRPPNIYDPSTFTEPYAYAGGNPVMYWDWNGLAKKPGPFREQGESESDEAYAEALKAFYASPFLAAPDNDLEPFDFDPKTGMFREITEEHELKGQIHILETALKGHKGKNLPEHTTENSVEGHSKWLMSLDAQQKDYANKRNILRDLKSIEPTFKEKTTPDSWWEKYTSLWGSHDSSIFIDHNSATLANVRGSHTNLSNYERLQEKLAIAQVGSGSTPSKPAKGPTLQRSYKRPTTVAPNTGAKWSADSGFYEVGFEARLTKGRDYPGTSDKRHFQQANKQLHTKFQSDPKFAKNMESLYPGIIEGVQPGKRGAFPRRPPTKDLTWNHDAYREGVLQLVLRKQHKAAGEIQKVLHPDGRGGMANWGGGR